MRSGVEAATRHYRAGRFAEAAAVCCAVLAVEPVDAEALNLLGVSLFSSGRDGAAAESLNRAVRTAPGHVVALTNLAVVRQHQRNWGAASRILRRLAVCAPDSAEACGRLATVAGEAGDLDSALRLSRRAVRLEPRSARHWFALAMVRILAGDAAGAAGDLRRAILIAPGDGPAHAALGDALLRLGRMMLAAGVFRRALLLDPAAADALDGLARCGCYQSAAAAATASDPAIATAARGLVVRGAFASTTGYGYFCRRVIQTLRARGVPLQAIGIKGRENWANEPLARPVSARAMVNFAIPLAVEPVPGLSTVTFSMFEGPRIPAAWRRQSDSSDLIIVPCESSRLAWMAQGYPEDRLRVCPLGVDTDDAMAGGSPLILVEAGGRLVSSYRHRVLNISDFTPRKNIDGLFRVWLRSTTRADDAVLILKLGKGGSPSMHADLARLVRRAEAAVGRSLADAAPVVLVDRTLSDAEMSGLLRCATHYWSLSHGEGWDLPLSTAGAMGVSLIAPRHSAYLDYLDDRYARLIPATIGPALLPYSDQPFAPFHGLDWWHPDEDAATAILTGIIRGDDRAAGAAPASARDHLSQHFSWGQAAERLLAILDEAGAR